MGPVASDGWNPLSIHPDVRFAFDGFRPERSSKLSNWPSGASVKLLLTDNDHEKRERVRDLRITKFTFDSSDLAGELTQTADGYQVGAVGLPGSRPGRHTISLALKDADGRRFAHAWQFDYNPNPPSFMLAYRFAGKNAAGNFGNLGYCAEFENRVDKSFDQFLLEPANWRIQVKATGLPVTISSVRRTPGMANLFELYCEGDEWQSKECDVDFSCPQLPNYAFDQNMRQTSNAVDDCMDLNKDCGDPPPPPPPYQWPVGPLVPAPPDPDVPPPPCCNSDICEVKSGDFQCCGPMLRIKVGMCQQCTQGYWWYSECVSKGGGPGHDHRLPEAGEICPLEDPRPLNPCDLPPDDFHAFNVGYGTYIFNLDGPTDKRETLNVMFGQWMKDENDHWKWCSSFFTSTKGGDVDNPKVDVSFVDHVDASGPGCERYHLNVGEPGFEAALEMAQAGCNWRFLKVHYTDLCLDQHARAPGEPLEVPGECSAIPKDVLDHPEDHQGVAYPMHWLTLWDLAEAAAYVCDPTVYSNCEDRSGSQNQELICYYLWPKEIDPDVTALYEPVGPGGLPIVHWDNQSYLAFMRSDWNWDVCLFPGCNWATGCAIDGPPQNPWDTGNTKIYKRIDEGNFNLATENEFRRIDLTPGNPSDNEFVLEPTEAVEETSFNDVEDNGIPFALYYKWSVEATGLHAILAAPPGTPQSDQKAGRPKLWVQVPDGPDQYWVPQEEAKGFATGECKKYDSGVWCWPCTRDAISHATIVASPKTAKSQAQYLQQTGFSNMKKREKITVTHQLLNAYDSSNVLHNPVVGSYETNNTDHSIYADGPTPYQDGAAPFAYATIECCEKPTYLEVYLDMTPAGWAPLESSGQNYQNAWDYMDAVNHGYAGWLDPAIVYQQVQDKSFPAVLFKEALLPQQVIAEKFHRGHADITGEHADPLVRDTVNDILRLNPDPDGAGPGRSGFSIFVDPSEGGSPIQLGHPIFTVAWDGRQWLLDQGADHDTSQQSLGDGGAMMYPPGEYSLCIYAEFPTGPPATKKIGTVKLAYGEQLYDGDCRTSFLGLGDGVSDKLPQVKNILNGDHHAAFLYGAEGNMVGLHRGPAEVTRSSGRVYNPIFWYNGHTEPWQNPELGPNIAPLGYQLAFLNQCDGWGERDYFSTARSFIGWWGETADLYSGDYELKLANEMSNYPNKTIYDCIVDTTKQCEKGAVFYAGWIRQHSVVAAGKGEWGPRQRGPGLLVDTYGGFERTDQ